MTGLIWIIQVIHYPSYRFIAEDKFTEFHHFHTTAITMIVGPMMVIEVFSGLAILIDQKFNTISAINFLGLLGIWFATAFLSVPTHNLLSKGFNLENINYLVQTNWIRTILWTARSGLIVYLLILHQMD